VKSTCLLLLLVGCGNMSQQRHLVTSVPRLRAAAESVINHSDVTVSIDPITSVNWRDNPEVTARVSMLVNDTSQSRGADATAATAPSVTVRFEDMRLMPLPAFRVTISNNSEGKVGFAHAHARLSDDAQTVDSLDAGEVRRRVDVDVQMRRNRQNGSITPEEMTNIRAAIDKLPLLKTDTVIDPQHDWHGYASFRMESAQPITHLVFLLEGVTLDDKPLPPFRVPFVVERRHSARACKDGSVATPLGVCPGDDEEMWPANEGPCIQVTRVPNNSLGKQWWVGGEPVANSDLHSTLMANADSRSAIRRGLYERGFGYSLVLGGLLLSGTMAFGFDEIYGRQYAPAGLAFLAITVVGGGLSYAGTRRTEAAIRAYNEQAEAGGVCEVVY
jgi:hypothetical protein